MEFDKNRCRFDFDGYVLETKAVTRTLYPYEVNKEMVTPLADLSAVELSGIDELFGTVKLGYMDPGIVPIASQTPFAWGRN